MKAKKSLGQHFLKSDSALEKITEVIEIKPRELLLEIGPGHGELTEKLLNRKVKVIAVEKDGYLIPILNEKFAKKIKEKKLKLIQADIVRITEKDICLNNKNKRYKVVGNIPYYITGLLLKKFLSFDNKPEKIIFLVQKEVADRVVLSKKESILSLSIKVYGNPKREGVVKAGSFLPPPKVDSAILSISEIKDPFKNKASEKLFFEIIKTGFSQKRKTLLSNLSKKIDKKTLTKVFNEIDLDFKTRAEDVSLDKWFCLTSELKKIK